ncbi:RNA-binding domain-containing protein [Xylariaceae sp. FL0804]|nr:RNA-binding domain-containing protein [Xylariaceae sp. FL0804]
MAVESSRIFVRGLPPTITESDLRKHFTAKGTITDIKCIPHRRIGYVGYTSPQEAAKAVKYFNRSFIRMSKIAVELARPVADPSLSKNQLPRNGQINAHTPDASAVESLASQAQPNNDNARKRKRNTPDENDPKLREYLSVMHSSKHAAGESHGIEGETAMEPPKKLAAVAAEEGSDDEYEAIPARNRRVPLQEAREAPGPPVQTTDPSKADIPEAVEANGEDEKGATRHLDTAANHTVDTDDDWLRQRTNRLLDLVDDDEITPEIKKPVEPPSEPPQVSDQMQPNDDVETGSPRNEDAGVDHGSQAPETQPQDMISKIRKTSRVFVRNLPYTATENDLRSYFEKCGKIEEVHVPSDVSKNNRGMGYILFTNPDDAVKAFQLDRSSFQGRILHVLPAASKRDHDLDEAALSKLPLKKQNLIKKRNQAASSRFQWNSLFMSQDAVNTSVADRLGISKSELFDHTSTDAAVKQAIAETSTIQDTKAYFLAHGIDLDSFKSAAKGDTAILVKNFPYGTKTEEIRGLFEEYGQVLKVLLPPAGVSAIVQFAQASDAKKAFAKLAYRRFKESILFLEKAPKNMFTTPGPETHQEGKSSAGVQKLSASELLEDDDSKNSVEASSIFVKNLSWDTNTEELADAFKHLEGYRSAIVKAKKDPSKPGQFLSMGFGFVSFASKTNAEAAIKVMDGNVLRGHKLQVRGSHRGQDAAEQRKKEELAQKNAGDTRIIIKNLAFQVNRQDLRALLSPYGKLKSVRIPKKFNAGSKGFAFADFVSPKEAQSALSALRDTHLLGRKLVLEYAEADAMDAEEEIAKMQKKVGGQASKVALQRLTEGSRKRVTLGGDDDEGEER